MSNLGMEKGLLNTKSILIQSLLYVKIMNSKDTFKFLCSVVACANNCSGRYNFRARNKLCKNPQYDANKSANHLDIYVSKVE